MNGIANHDGAIMDMAVTNDQARLQHVTACSHSPVTCSLHACVCMQAAD